MEFRGRYFGGSSLEAQQVVLSFDAGRLLIRTLEGDTIAAYQQSYVQVLFVDRLGNRIDLGIDGVRDLRVMVEADGVRDAVLQALPPGAWQGQPDNWRAATRISTFLVALLALLGVLFWQVEKVLPALIPESFERELGQDLLASLSRSNGGQCDGGPGLAALEKVLHRLGGDQIGSAGVTVTVVHSETVNAFALPGGQLVLFDGLIQQAASIEEVAGVLAHEMGHEQHRHAMRGLTRTIAFQLFAAMISGGSVTQLSEQLLLLAYSRAMEEDADEAALVLLQNAAIPAEPLADFFDRLANKGASDGSGTGDPSPDGSNYEYLANFLSTHPASAERAAAIRRSPSIEGRPVLTEEEWQAFRAICGADKSKE